MHTKEEISSELIRATDIIPMTTEVEKTVDTEALQGCGQPVSEKENI